jgi:hypothetical protein
MQRREDRLRKKLSKVDSNSAKQLFVGSARRYAALEAKMRADTGCGNMPLTGTYMPYIDSLQGALTFLKKNPDLVKGMPAGGALGQFQALQAKMQDADQIKSFVQQRKQQIGQYLSQHPNLQGLLGKEYSGLNQDVYYYSQQLRQYKEMWAHPDQLEQKTLALLNKLPTFQTFMKNNSQLSGLFSMPANYGSSAGLAGLQTTERIVQQIQTAVGGPEGVQGLQQNMQSANSQLDDYKSKVSRMGQGNGNLDMPDFKPNDQKTKTFLQRLEYGANFQTTHNTYYIPTVTDIGLSLGYDLGHSNIVGVGASYKVGWGNGIKHISFTSQGVGLRSFLEIKIKSSFSAAGGFEYNYTTPFTSFQDIKQIERWTRSGLLGISKTVSMKSKVFKKTKMQLLWDFLSYQQVPKTQAILFRLGYAW